MQVLPFLTQFFSQAGLQCVLTDERNSQKIIFSKALVLFHSDIILPGIFNPRHTWFCGWKILIARRRFFKEPKNYSTIYLTPTAQNTPQTNNQPLCFTPSYYHRHHNHRNFHHHCHRYHSPCFVRLAVSGSWWWCSTSDPNGTSPLSQGMYEEDTEREGTGIGRVLTITLFVRPPMYRSHPDHNIPKYT